MTASLSSLQCQPFCLPHYQVSQGPTSSLPSSAKYVTLWSLLLPTIPRSEWSRQSGLRHFPASTPQRHYFRSAPISCQHGKLAGWEKFWHFSAGDDCRNESAKENRICSPPPTGATDLGQKELDSLYRGLSPVLISSVLLLGRLSPTLGKRHSISLQAPLWYEQRNS